jgi:hypothetical protein
VALEAADGGAHLGVLVGSEPGSVVLADTAARTAPSASHPLSAATTPAISADVDTPQRSRATVTKCALLAA